MNGIEFVFQALMFVLIGALAGYALRGADDKISAKYDRDHAKKK